jgi:flagellar biosynthesis regulator FlaF
MVQQDSTIETTEALFEALTGEHRAAVISFALFLLETSEELPQRRQHAPYRGRPGARQVH